jgi:hypothetical protein
MRRITPHEITQAQRFTREMAEQADHARAAEHYARVLGEAEADPLDGSEEPFEVLAEPIAEYYAELLEGEPKRRRVPPRWPRRALCVGLLALLLGVLPVQEAGAQKAVRKHPYLTIAQGRAAIEHTERAYYRRGEREERAEGEQPARSTVSVILCHSSRARIRCTVTVAGIGTLNGKPLGGELIYTDTATLRHGHIHVESGPATLS